MQSSVANVDHDAPVDSLATNGDEISELGPLLIVLFLCAWIARVKSQPA